MLNWYLKEREDKWIQKIKEEMKEIKKKEGKMNMENDVGIA